MNEFNGSVSLRYGDRHLLRSLILSELERRTTQGEYRASLEDLLKRLAERVSSEVTPIDEILKKYPEKI